MRFGPVNLRAWLPYLMSNSQHTGYYLIKLSFFKLIFQTSSFKMLSWHIISGDIYFKFEFEEKSYSDRTYSHKRNNNIITINMMKDFAKLHDYLEDCVYTKCLRTCSAESSLSCEC